MGEAVDTELPDWLPLVCEAEEVADREVDRLEPVADELTEGLLTEGLLATRDDEELEPDEGAALMRDGPFDREAEELAGIEEDGLRLVDVATLDELLDDANFEELTNPRAN